MVAKSFPDSRRSAVAGIFFLRFLGPVLVDPVGSGALDRYESLDREKRRNLVLIYKALQSLANGVEFDGTKEHYMMGLNKFVRSRRARMGEILNILAVCTAGAPRMAIGMLMMR